MLAIQDASYRTARISSSVICIWELEADDTDRFATCHGSGRQEQQSISCDAQLHYHKIITFISDGKYALPEHSWCNPFYAPAMVSYDVLV